VPLNTQSGSVLDKKHLHSLSQTHRHNVPSPPKNLTCLRFVIPLVIFQVSTINLTLVRAEFFSNMATTLNMACFVVCFFAFRIVYVPIYWYYLILDLVQQRHTEAFQSCLPWHFPYVCFVMGSFFHCLNAFWFYKILKKVERKIKGAEHLKANNELGESPQKKSN
jgi:TLC domain